MAKPAKQPARTRRRSAADSEPESTRGRARPVSTVTLAASAATVAERGTESESDPRLVEANTSGRRGAAQRPTATRAGSNGKHASARAPSKDNARANQSAPSARNAKSASNKGGSGKGVAVTVRKPDGDEPAPQTTPAAPPVAEIDTTAVDAATVAACLEGDESAYQTLVERYQNRCYWTAYKFVQNAEDALDVVQEAFVKAFRQLQSFDTSRRFFTWMYRIVINVAIDAIRRKEVRPAVALDDMGDVLPDEGAISPSSHVARVETKDDVHRVLTMLPEAYRSVLVMREIEGLSCKEIGEVIDVPHATVRWRLHHARSMFKDIWERRVLKLRDGERAESDGTAATTDPMPEGAYDDDD